MEDQAVSKANQYLFCDTSAFTTWHFALHYHQSALPELAQLAIQCWQRYDLVVLCDDDIPYDDTWSVQVMLIAMNFRRLTVNILNNMASNTYLYRVTSHKGKKPCLNHWAWYQLKCVPVN